MRKLEESHGKILVLSLLLLAGCSQIIANAFERVSCALLDIM